MSRPEEDGGKAENGASQMHGVRPFSGCHRNQRVRTYNFPQNRVTDHRINSNFNLERIVEQGDVEPIILALRGYERDMRMKEL